MLPIPFIHSAVGEVLNQAPLMTRRGPGLTATYRTFQAVCMGPPAGYSITISSLGRSARLPGWALPGLVTVPSRAAAAAAPSKQAVSRRRLMHTLLVSLVLGHSSSGAPNGE